MQKNVESVVFSLARPLADALGVELYDVEFVKEGGAYYLRVYIDAEGGVDIDTCEAMSRALDPVLDEADPIEESYYLEVGSVGLDRPLKKEKDFLHFLQTDVEVRLFAPLDGQKEWVGRLTAYHDGEFTIDVGGTPKTFSVKQTALVRPYIEF